MAFIDQIDSMDPSPSLWRAAAAEHYSDATIMRRSGASFASTSEMLSKTLLAALKACLAQQGRLYDVDRRDSLVGLARIAGVEGLLPQGALIPEQLEGASVEDVLLDEACCFYEGLTALRSDTLLPGAPSGREQAEAAARYAAARKQDTLFALSAQERERQRALEEEGLDAARRLAPIALALFPGAEVYLFGSRAKGYASEYSDIDVAVITSHADAERLEKHVELSMAAFDVDSRLETIVRHVDDSTGFVRSVLLTGIRAA